MFDASAATTFLPALPARARLESYIDPAINVGLHLLAALLLLLVGLWVVRRLADAAQRALGRAKFDDMLAGFLRNVLYGVLVALLLVMSLSVVGIPSAPMVAALGTAGLAVGLALQGSLSNLAWGVLLVIFRPFAVGDFVQAGGIDGTVGNLSLMYTQLLLPDGREAIVPNGKVGASAIINYNRRGTRRFELTVGIGYRDDIGHAMDAVRGVLAEDKRVLDDPAPGVWTSGLGESSVDLVIRGWTTTGDLWATQTDVRRAIKEAFDAGGISIPFPQRELTVLKGDALNARSALTPPGES